MMDLVEAEEEFDILNSALQDRMQEYIAAIGAIPYATGTGKVDLWNAAVEKLDEINNLHGRLGDLTKFLEAQSSAGPTPAVNILVKAGKATGWVPTGEYASARVLIREWQEKARSIKDPVARDSALKWLTKALRFAEADRLAQTTECLKNAKPLLNR